ncbi:MAG: LysM peptidoglycan-binding domain-containing protein [Acidobacteria bacterium]|nr:MAG: LysM peptidoglycan-binding domain-containing protein [Acidobacteriota bacterium]
MKLVRQTWVRPAAVLAGAALLAAPALCQPSADGERIRGYVPPPTGLKLVGDHWTPYDPPTPPQGEKIYVIQKGDTLWDLAGRFYGDNYLWPVIWDANRYITYSHWIYPGDPLVVPPRPGVVGEEGLKEAEPPAAEEKAEVPAPPPPPEKPAGPVLVAAAEEEELVCLPQLVETFDPGPLTIVGSDEPERELNSPGDILFLSAGIDFGIEPGAEFVVVRSAGPVPHPQTGEPAAVYVRRLGKLRVIAVQENSATAEIVYACDAIRVGDHLVPYHETPVPMIEKVPLAKLATPKPGPTNGSVVVTLDPQATVAGTGDLVGIDLGSRAGVTAGDRILFWRDAGPTLPRKVVAQGVVLSANGGGSTVKIIESWQEVRLGDRAELL